MVKGPGRRERQIVPGVYSCGHQVRAIFTKSVLLKFPILRRIIIKTVRDSVFILLTTGVSFHFLNRDFFNQQTEDYIELCIQHFRSICFQLESVSHLTVHFSNGWTIPLT
jgi:hypothetical protein